jgi:short-subunit dehydrogenase
MIMRYRSALITGASSGIGRSLATCLAQAGTEVVLCARRTAELQNVADQISLAGGRARVLPIDVADTERSVAAIRHVDKDIGGLDLIVACAGIGLAMDAKRMTWERIAELLQVNFNGAVATLCAVLPQFVERRRGHLVGVSSIGALAPLPTGSAYCGSKAGLAMFCDILRLDLTGSGVNVTCVFPGPVRTPMVAHITKEPPFMVGPDEAAALILRRLRNAPAVIEFPLPMALTLRTLAVLPTALRDVAVRHFPRPDENK